MTSILLRTEGMVYPSRNVSNRMSRAFAHTSSPCAGAPRSACKLHAPSPRVFADVHSLCKQALKAVSGAISTPPNIPVVGAHPRMLSRVNAPFATSDASMSYTASRERPRSTVRSSLRLEALAQELVGRARKLGTRKRNDVHGHHNAQCGAAFQNTTPKNTDMHKFLCNQQQHSVQAKAVQVLQLAP